MVFVEAFGFEGKHPLHLSLESVQFTVSLGLFCDPMQVFVALVPELDGVIHGDCNRSSGLRQTSDSLVSQKNCFISCLTFGHASTVFH